MIAGPCSLEPSNLNLKIGFELARISESCGVPIIFKGSFDKANRSKLESPRGPGLEEGLRLLAEVKKETGLLILTDIHEAHQAKEVASVVDIIQIPAFLSRQTDLLEAAGKTGRPVNIKKAQWMSSNELVGAKQKVQNPSNSEVIVTERGTFFGYGDLVVDMRNFLRIQKELLCPVYFDGTHAIQRPGCKSGSTGGDSVYTSGLVLAAVAAGCDGLFLEVHPTPLRAPSDASTMLQLNKLESLLRKAISIKAILND
ncbi:MAG: 3-deoxy-8-phosphooctulonate synthase [Longimicrobiales bacterium]|nr:3-deoxy-8-phosphooctulonate synthase [Longimicrobiales bacterium]